LVFALGAAGWEPDGVGLAFFTALVTLGTVGLTLAVRVRSLAPLHLHRPGTRWLWTGLAVGVALRLVALAVFAVWIAVTGDAWNPQQEFADAAALGGWSLVAILALGGLVIPFAEELLFRGVLYGALRRYGPVLAGLVSAAVFGIAHVWPPLIPLRLPRGRRARLAAGALRLDLARRGLPRCDQHAVDRRDRAGRLIPYRCRRSRSRPATHWRIYLWGV
jgi:membrane protease YdiL (CAAX protease family)